MRHPSSGGSKWPHAGGLSSVSEAVCSVRGVGVLKNSSRLGLQEAGLLLAQWPPLVVMMEACG